MEPRKAPQDRAGESGCERPDLAARLVEWDELEAPAQRELAEHAAACGACGSKLELLQSAQAWLEAPQGTRVCPSAEDLYDFGRGAGARALSEPERVSIKAHLASCAECSALVETLASRPPAPLIGDPEPAAQERRALPPPRRARPLWRRLAWIPVAAAAGFLAVAIWPSESSSRERSGALAIRFPAAPVLRGSADDALLFPRDRVLRGADGLFAPLVFELAPRDRAQSYRVRVSRHDGSAFASGAPVATFSGGAQIAAEGLGDAGHYTWEAWAVVDGLDVPLGRRDFEIVRDDALVAEIETRRSAPEPARSESILHLLHDAGFVGDARAFARTLPKSPERDAYLARLPGR